MSAAPLFPAIPGEPCLTDAVAPLPYAVHQPFQALHYNFPAPVQQYAVPAPVAYAAAPAPFAPAFHTNVHYAESPVVVAHNTHILKPNLGFASFDYVAPAPVNIAPPVVVQQIAAPVVEPAKAVEIVAEPAAAPAVEPAPAPVVEQPAPAVQDVPCLDAAPVVVQKHEFVAPVFAVPQVIPHQVVVHQPATKVIVQKIEVPVPAAPVQEVHFVRVAKTLDSRESREYDSRENESVETSD